MYKYAPYKLLRRPRSTFCSCFVKQELKTSHEFTILHFIIVSRKVPGMCCDAGGQIIDFGIVIIQY